MFGSKLTDEKNTIIIDEDIFEGLDDFLDFPIEDDGLGKFNSIERSSSLPPLPDVLIDSTDQKFIPQITNDLHIPYEELPPIDWIPKFPDFEAIDENLITFNNYDNNSDDTIFENKNDIVKIENSNVYNDDDDDVIYQSTSPSSVLDLGSSNFYSAEKTETYAKRKRSRSRGRGVNQRVSSLSSDNSSEESHPVVAKEKKKKTIRKCLHCEITETPQWRAGPDGPKTLCNACGVRFKSGRLCAEYRPAASPTFVPSKHSNSHKKVLEMRRRCKEFQNPEFTPMRQAFV